MAEIALEFQGSLLWKLWVKDLYTFLNDKYRYDIKLDSENW